nr:MAG TPA: hypothetical protein [Caudoviricetes sp.]
MFTNPSLIGYIYVSRSLLAQGPVFYFTMFVL